MFFEIGATVFGLIQGVLVMLNKRSNWIAYALQMVFLLIFSLINRLYGDLVNAALYLALGVVGFILWGKEKHQKITVCSWKERLTYLAVMAVGTCGVFFLLQRTDDPLPLLDAFTTVSSLIATYYMLVKKIDTWLIWFVNDLFYVVEYCLLPNPAWTLLGLNVVWTVMAVVSCVAWRKMMKEEKGENLIKRYVCTRERTLERLSKREDVKVTRLENGLILVDSAQVLTEKGLVDVTDNTRYAEENLPQILVPRVAIEGTDGVGKTSVIVGLVVEGIVCFDRDTTICQYMLFDVDMETRCRAYEKYFSEGGNGILFLINDDKEELERRIYSRGAVSEFDEQAYAYNLLYKDTYLAMQAYDTQGKLQMVDCTGLPLDEMIARARACILQEMQS